MLSYGKKEPTKPKHNKYNATNKKKKKQAKIVSLFIMKKSFSKIKWDSGFFDHVLV